MTVSGGLPLADGEDEATQDAPRQGGVQSVRRAISLLNALAQSSSDGERLSTLADMVDLDRGTTRRLLATLIDSGMVEQDAATKHYQLGLAFFSLAAAASNRYDLQEVASDSLKRIAQETGDTVFLALRSGEDVICVDAQSGAYPVQAMPMDIGSHRPLGAGSSGVCILLPLPDAEIAQILKRNHNRLALFAGQDPDSIWTLINDSRPLGYVAAREASGPPIASISAPLINRRGRAVGCLTVSATEDRLSADRRDGVAEVLIREAQHISQIMWRLPDTDRHRSTWPREHEAGQTK